MPTQLQQSMADKKNGAKHRQPGFYLKTTTLTKLMRQVCKDKLPRRSGAINPFKEISIEGIKVILWCYHYSEIFLLHFIDLCYMVLSLELKTITFRKHAKNDSKRSPSVPF